MTSPSGSSASLYSLDWHLYTPYMDCTWWQGAGNQSKQWVSSPQLHCTLTSPTCKCSVGTADLFINVTSPSMSPPDLSLPSEMWTHLPLLVSGTADVTFLLPLPVCYTWPYSTFDFMTKGRYKSELTAQIFLSEGFNRWKNTVWA